MCRGLPLEGPALAGPLSQPRQHAKQAPAGSKPQQYDDDFLVYSYKVVPCDKAWRHDYSSCPFAHSGESSERRHPSAYLPFMCGSTQHSTDLKEKCPFGTSCKYAHGHFELWLHPGRFRTKMCSLGSNCRRPVCFFAHSEQELRVTPYSKLDTAAAVAAQQLAEMQASEVSPCASIAAGSNPSSVRSASSDGSDIKAALNGLCSPCGSESGLPCGTPAGSATAVDDLAALTAGMMLNTQAAVLDMQLQGNANALLRTADAATGLAADAAIAASAPGLWLAGSSAGMLPQQLPVASRGYAGGMLPQQQLMYLDAAANTMRYVAAATSSADLMNGWMLAPSAPAPVGPSVAALADQWAASSMMQRTVYGGLAGGSAGFTAACNPAVQIQGLPMPNMLGNCNVLDQWLQLENAGNAYGGPPGLNNRPVMGCGINAAPQQQPSAANARMVQLLSTLPDQTVQQLLGMLTVEAQGA